MADSPSRGRYNQSFTKKNKKKHDFYATVMKHRSIGLVTLNETLYSAICTDQ